MSLVIDMAANTEFEYEAFVRDKLKPHPPGRTTEELEDALPADADPDQLRETLERLATNGSVRQIGSTWRWMDF